MSQLIQKSNEIKNLNIKSRVLIADDFLISLKFLQQILTNLGVDVTAVTDGKEVIDTILKDSNYNLIILDSKMPKLDAYDTIKLIRNNQEFKNMPVIIHSSFSYDHKINEMNKLGFNAYLPQPFTATQLQQILNRYLNIKSNKKYIQYQKVKKYEEFLAIYSNSGNILKRYIKENKYSQAIVLLEYLKNIIIQIGTKELIEIVEELYIDLHTEKADSNLIKTLIKQIDTLTLQIKKKLQH